MTEWDAYRAALRFLTDDTIHPDAADALRELGHHAATRADLALGPDAPVAEVLKTCRRTQHELLTASADFLDAALPASGRAEVFGRVMVYLLDANDQAESVKRLFARYKRLTPGRLYTVTAGRVKVRQLPTGAAVSL